MDNTFVHSTHFELVLLAPKIESGKSVQHNYHSSSSKEMWSILERKCSEMNKKLTKVQIEKRKI